MKKLNKWFAERNIEYKKYLVIFYVLLIMIPSLIIVSVLSPKDDMMVRSIAISLLLILFVAFFVYSGKRRIAKLWGVYACGVQKNVDKTIVEFTDKAKNICIITAAELEQTERILENAVGTELESMRLMLLDPAAETVCELEKWCGMESGEYRRRVERLCAFEEPLAGKLQIRFYQGIPMDTVCLADAFTAVLPLTQRLQNGQSVSTLYSGKRMGYQHYWTYFNTLWAQYGEEDGEEKA